MSPKINNIGFGSHMVKSARSGNHENVGVGGSPIMDPERYESEMKQNNSSIS